MDRNIRIHVTLDSKDSIYDRTNDFLIKHSRKCAFQDAWTNAKKEGLEQFIKEKLPTIEEKKMEDLMVILERHFDPEKKPKGRVLEKKGLKTRNEKKISDDKENNNKSDSGHDSPDSPDTTTSGSPVKINGTDVEIKPEASSLTQESAENV